MKILNIPKILEGRPYKNFATKKVEFTGGSSLPSPALITFATIRLPRKGTVLSLRKVSDRSSMSLATVTCIFKSLRNRGTFIFGGKELGDYVVIKQRNLAQVLNSALKK